ncbi:MAG: hypothetical protein IME96_04800 [Proteobacteria bacterium]|nr:hypothetical protein [Pseudomonadota bacterium]
MKRNIYIFALLFAIFAILFVRNVQKGEQGRVSELTFKTAEAKNVTGEDSGEVLRIKRELLNPKREKFRIGGKWLFEPLQFFVKKPPAPPVKLPPAPPEPPVEVETPMEKAMATFTFLGFMESEKVKTTFLSREGEIFIVKKGDSILQEYVVKEITDRNMIISSFDGSETLDIDLVENQPLKKK